MNGFDFSQIRKENEKTDTGKYIGTRFHKRSARGNRFFLSRAIDSIRVRMDKPTSYLADCPSETTRISIVCRFIRRFSLDRVMFVIRLSEDHSNRGRTTY